MEAIEALRKAGYIDATEAAVIMCRSVGGDLFSNLAQAGISHVLIPFKSGDKKRWFFKKDELEAYAKKMGIGTEKQSGRMNGGKLLSRIVKVENRVEELANELRELKQSLGE